VRGVPGQQRVAEVRLRRVGFVITHAIGVTVDAVEGVNLTCGRGGDVFNPHAPAVGVLALQVDRMVIDERGRQRHGYGVSHLAILTDPTDNKTGAGPGTSFGMNPAIAPQVSGR